jgi:hypothetical protein
MAKKLKIEETVIAVTKKVGKNTYIKEGTKFYFLEKGKKTLTTSKSVEALFDVKKSK